MHTGEQQAGADDTSQGGRGGCLTEQGKGATGSAFQAAKLAD